MHIRGRSRNVCRNDWTATCSPEMPRIRVANSCAFESDRPSRLYSLHQILSRDILQSDIQRFNARFKLRFVRPSTRQQEFEWEDKQRESA